MVAPDSSTFESRTRTTVRPVFPFLSLTTLAAALRADYAGRPISSAMADELSLAICDTRSYEASYGMHLLPPRLKRRQTAS